MFGTVNGIVFVLFLVSIRKQSKKKCFISFGSVLFVEVAVGGFQSGYTVVCEMHVS